MYYNIIEYTIYLNAENWIITVKGPDDLVVENFFSRLISSSLFLFPIKLPVK
jgi:hypothetical protein